MIIIANKPGQLGNRLFVFAHFIAYAAEYGVTVYNPAFDEYAQYFKASTGSMVPRYPAKNTALHPEALRRPIFRVNNFIARAARKLKMKNALVSNSFTDWGDYHELKNDTTFQRSAFHFIEGWGFRGKELFRKHAGVIRQYFQPQDNYTKNLEKRITELREGIDILIGVHIRHGDYKDFEGGKYYYSMEQYNRFMQQAQQAHPGKKVRFMICSNLPLKEEDFRPFDFGFGPGHFIEDMYAFARCDYILGPPSTFTFWASFMGEVPLYKIEDPQKPFGKQDFEVFLEG